MKMAESLYEGKDYRSWVLLVYTRDLIYQLRTKELRKHGVSQEEMGVFCLVESLGKKAIAAEIARWLVRKPHTISDLVRRMVNKGLLIKTRDLDRKNVVRLSLTDKGKEIFEKAKELQSIHNVMSCLSENEQRQLDTYLSKLRDEALRQHGGSVQTPSL